MKNDLTKRSRTFHQQTGSTGRSLAALLNSNVMHVGQTMKSIREFLSNRSRLVWRSAALFAVTTGGITQFVDFKGFVGNYWFDMAFPVFMYIYLRKTIGINERKESSPIHQNLALTLALVPAFLLETLQYFDWYKGTFDPIDFLAYLSLVVPAYLIDRRELASG